jgi:pimeloyl-ACP methyl ester carboxylesterase
MKEISLDTARGPIVGLRSGDPAGAKLLALHGWLDNAASFIPLMPELAMFDLVALDLPGHGASAHRLPGYDYVFVDWIHDVLDVLDALQWPRANLLGHSMGGAIATVVATSAPARIDKLALIEALGPLPGFPGDAGEKLRNAVAARRAFDPTRTPRVIPDLETAVDARLVASTMERAAARLIVERNLRPVSDGFVWRSDPRLTLPSHVRTDESFVRSWLRAIEAPTLLIAAEPAPPYFPPEARNTRLAELRDGRLELVPGGHHLHMEQPARIGALLRDFLV